MKKYSIICALAVAFCTALALPGIAEDNDAFLVQKSIEISQKLQLMAGNDAYIKLLYPMGPLEHAAKVAAADLQRPERAILISANREFPELLIEQLRTVAPELVDDPVILETLMNRAAGSLVDTLIGTQGSTDWFRLNSILAIGDTDTLPDGLHDIEYLLLFYPEEGLVTMTVFYAVPRWGYVAYHSNFLPLTDELIALDRKENIGKLITGEDLSGYVIASRLESRTLEQEELEALLATAPDP